MKNLIMCIAAFALAAAPVSCKENKSAKNNAAAAVVESAVGEAESGNDGITVLKDEKLKDGTRKISVRPSNVCSRQIDITVKGGVIVEVAFTGGCPGNSQGICKLVKGMKITDAIAELDGIDCAGRGTSCPDQLAKALKHLL